MIVWVIDTGQVAFKGRLTFLMCINKYVMRLLCMVITFAQMAADFVVVLVLTVSILLLTPLMSSVKELEVAAVAARLTPV